MTFQQETMEHVNNYLDKLTDFRAADMSQSQTALVFGLGLVGGVWLLTQLLTFVRVLLSLFVIPGRSLRSFGPKGSWALITGASDGLGKEFALQIARAGFNVLLVSRTESKLVSLADEIKSKNPSTQTKILAMDFAANKDSDYEQLKSLVDNLDIAILVNNVGKSHSIPVPFSETPDDEMKDIITINCTGTLRVTKLVTPGMIQRKRGLILTMGSFGGLLPTPLLATYSGSKAFLQYWSSALGSELEPYGITVQLLQAHLITSAMSKIRRPSLTVPTPKAWVKTALNKIGRRGGSPHFYYTSSPYFSHGLMAWFITCVVGVWSNWLKNYNLNMHVGIRKRALRKLERSKTK
ncbi:ketoreductase, putative [Talaromyces stipitatus ATCC 10500]|uniref:Very-long-chain 3-oxoacyl-CoA reductase n=1 Tax=Talaromyces stipitatus (strain ATCC 10500 / CBS 375.48 / QM 6759 / NRRL 1006) TaxID=441959 RepID=B8M3U4_TALSN|nr:ketoreductase, putative [Talaromyces stipitatus ATCC 10500]EED20687.1 ketoreductase, putative [Talaromyces stipitatus ATCC 10500]